MPGFDGTGPRGAGPMTGYGRGYCILKVPGAKYRLLEGFAGLQGVAVGQLAVSEDAERRYTMPRGDGTGPAGQQPGRGRGGGRGRRRSTGPVGQSFAAGPGGVCTCPKCGYQTPHIQGLPCNKRMCLKCNVPMQRV